MDILLISGPLTDPTQVPLALPALAAYLRSEGLTVEVWDLSIDCFDTLTSKLFLSDAVARIDRRRLAGNGAASEERQTAAVIARTLAPIVLERIEGAKATFRDTEQFYDYTAYKDALWALQAVNPILHAAYFPTKIDELVYDFGKELTVPNILQHLTDADSNLFLEYFTSIVVPTIERLQPPLIALSISWESQLVPALTLCRLLRERLSDVPIVLGGGYVTAVQDRLETETFLWDFATAIVLGEGESALTEICRRVKEGRDLTQIPNVVLKDDTIRAYSVCTADVRTLPTPDFTGLPLDRYFVPEPVLPVQSNRGCYWNKCTFCASANVTRHAYRQRPVEQLIQDMHAINETTGATTFFICDLTTPPAHMRDLAEHITAHELPFHWATETRFDLGLDEEACHAIAAGGCLNLSFGFESASDRVLALMRKGMTLATAKRVLEACKNAALSVTLFAFMGFPGETMEEAQATREFFVNHTDLYTGCALGSFKADLNCEVVQHPEQYGLLIADESPGLFVPTHNFTVNEGISREDAQIVINKTLINLLLRTHKLCTMWGAVGGPHDLLYLRRYGKEWRDTLDTSPRIVDTELNRTAYTVSADVMLKRIDERACILYKPTGAFAVVPAAVAHAVQLLQCQPQSIPAAVQLILSLMQQTVGAGSQDAQARLQEFYQVMLQVLHLAKAEFLVQRAPLTPN